MVSIHRGSFTTKKIPRSEAFSPQMCVRYDCDRASDLPLNVCYIAIISSWLSHLCEIAAMIQRNLGGSDGLGHILEPIPMA